MLSDGPSSAYNHFQSLLYTNTAMNQFQVFLSSLNIDPPTTLLAFTAIFTLLIFFASLRSRKTTPPLPPGPRGLPVIGNIASLDPNLHTYFAALSKTYGPILKLKLGQKLGIIITSPALAREVLKDHDVTFANRDVPVTGRVVSYGGSDIVWTPYGPTWRMLRKVCVLKLLSNTTLDSVYSLRRSEVRKTVGFLHSQAGSEVCVGEQVFLTSLKVITSMLWGDTVKGEERNKLGREFRAVVAQIVDLLGKPNLSDFFPALGRFDLQGMTKKMAYLAKQFDEIFDKVIDRRMKIDEKGEDGGDGKVKDFVQFLLKVKEEDDEKIPLTMNHVKALLTDMVVGGTDTSSNSIEFAMAEIINKPEVMAKIQEELDSVVGRDKIVEESHINELPYLHAVMKELLRLHPPLPLLVPHCPSEDTTIGGYSVPKGSRVFVNVWAIHRDPTIWENPLEFKPERFLETRWDYSGSDLSYFPFGSGRRICVGIAMAERMFMYSVATFLHCFDWKVPEGKKLDLTEQFAIVMKLKNPLIVIPVPRLSDPSLYQM